MILLAKEAKFTSPRPKKSTHTIYCVEDEQKVFGYCWIIPSQIRHFSSVRGSENTMPPPQKKSAFGTFMGPSSQCHRRKSGANWDENAGESRVSCPNGWDSRPRISPKARRKIQQSMHFCRFPALCIARGCLGVVIDWYSVFVCRMSWMSLRDITEVTVALRSFPSSSGDDELWSGTSGVTICKANPLPCSQRKNKPRIHQCGRPTFQSAKNQSPDSSVLFVLADSEEKENFSTHPKASNNSVLVNRFLSPLCKRDAKTHTLAKTTESVDSLYFFRQPLSSGPPCDWMIGILDHIMSDFCNQSRHLLTGRENNPTPLGILSLVHKCMTSVWLPGFFPAHSPFASQARIFWVCKQCFFFLSFTFDLKRKNRWRNF